MQKKLGGKYQVNIGVGTKTDGAPEEYMTYGHNQAAPSSSYLHTQLHRTRALALWTDALTPDHGRVLCIRECLLKTASA